MCILMDPVRLGVKTSHPLCAVYTTRVAQEQNKEFSKPQPKTWLTISMFPYNCFKRYLSTLHLHPRTSILLIRPSSCHRHDATTSAANLWSHNLSAPTKVMKFFNFSLREDTSMPNRLRDPSVQNLASSYRSNDP